MVRAEFLALAFGISTSVQLAHADCTPPSTRTDCGFYGISEQQCLAKNCCWLLPISADVNVTSSSPSTLPICFEASSQPSPSPLETEFVVHYLPWMKGPNSFHWCNTGHGNSYYGSVLGQWTCEDTSVLQWQAELMRAAGITGVFFDYQMEEWNSCIDKMVAIFKTLGLKYAIMPDTAEGADFLAGAMSWLKERMEDSNYLRHEGKPLLPMFDFTGSKAPSVSQLRAGLGDIVIVGRSQGELLSGADAYYQWISGVNPDSIDSYYNNPPGGTPPLVGGAWRGFEACYEESQPYLDHYENKDLLSATIGKAKLHKPPFCQIMTWNDYTEGTMIEPSFLIHDKGNGCNNIGLCANGEDQGGTPDCSLPYCQTEGTYCNQTSPHCASCNDGGLCSPYRDLIVLYKELVDSSRKDSEIEVIFRRIPMPSGAPFGVPTTFAV